MVCTYFYLLINESAKENRFLINADQNMNKTGNCKYYGTTL